MIFKPPPRPPGPEEGIEYRLYFFDGADHIEKSHEFIATDDETAIEIAEAWREGRRMELWARARLVKEWN